MTEPQMPTATIGDRVGEFLYPEERRALMIFETPDKKQFALKFDIKILVVLNKMVGVLLHQWHKLNPAAGVFCRDAGEATTITSNDRPGIIGIQFDGDIMYALPIPTALELAELIVKQVEKIETPSERQERLAKKHPTIITPKSRVIMP